MVLDEINLLAEGATVLHEDNAGAIRWSSGDQRAKHVDIRFHFLIDEVHNRTVQIHYCPTREIISDARKRRVSRKLISSICEKSYKSGNVLYCIRIKEGCWLK